MSEQGHKDMQVRKIPPVIDRIGELTAFLEEQLESAGAPARVIAQVNVAVDEIFSNIARYSGAKRASVGCRLQGNRVILRFEDDGSPYDPTKTPDPDITLSAENRKIGGLGIFMVKKTMDRVEYAYSGGCNILTVEKEWETE